MEFDNIDSAIATYIDFMVADYARFQNNMKGMNKSRNDELINHFRDSFEVRKGKKYIKVIADGSVKAFIVVAGDGKFKAGDLLKAASWATPAKNAARGNVLEGRYSGGWTGPAYMG